MKRIVIAFLLFSSLYGNAQQQTGAKEYHMAFHRQNKTIGFVLLGAGTGLITYAIVKNNDDFGTGAGLIAFGGIALCIASVPLFNSATRHKRKAAALGIKPHLVPGELLAAHNKKGRRPVGSLPSVFIKFNL